MARRGLDRLAREHMHVADDLSGRGSPGDFPQGIEVGKQLGIRVADLFVQPGARHHVGGGVEAECAAIEIEPVARIALDEVDRHQLRPRDTVQIGQFEAHILDAVGLQLRDGRRDLVVLRHRRCLPRGPCAGSNPRHPLIPSLNRSLIPPALVRAPAPVLKHYNRTTRRTLARRFLQAQQPSCDLGSPSGMLHRRYRPQGWRRERVRATRG